MQLSNIFVDIKSNNIALIKMFAISTNTISTAMSSNMRMHSTGRYIIATTSSTFVHNLHNLLSIKFD